MQVCHPQVPKSVTRSLQPTKLRGAFGTNPPTVVDNCHAFLRTHGRREDSGESLASKRVCKQEVFLHREAPRVTQIDKEGAKGGGGAQAAIFEIHRSLIVEQPSH